MAHFHQWSEGKWRLLGYAVQAQVYFILGSVQSVATFVSVFNISILFLKPQIPRYYTRSPNPEESASQRERSYIFKPHQGYSCSVSGLVIGLALHSPWQCVSIRRHPPTVGLEI